MDDKCNIARDLMPLIIDEAASEESVRFVDDHTAQCSECATFYQGMRTMLPKTTETEAEKKRFSKAAKKLRNRRWKRLVGWVCLGVALSLLLLAAYQRVSFWLTQVKDQPMRLEDYDVSLSAMANGECVITIQQAAPSIESDRDTLLVPENGAITAYVFLKTARLPRQNPNWTHNAQWNRDLYWDEDGLYYMEQGIRVPVAKVCKGLPEDCEPVYHQGESIVPASSGMERYFVQWDEYKRMISSPDSEEWNTEEFHQRLQDQYYLAEALEKLVPEWHSSAKAPVSSKDNDN